MRKVLILVAYYTVFVVGFSSTQFCLQKELFVDAVGLLFTEFASCPILMLGGRWLLGPRIP
jgi:hypothetical protein